MRDIPVFTTENGVATLILNQIPYTRRAYIHLRCTQRPLALLKDCVDFLRMTGAEELFATGDPALEVYPLYTRVIRMSRLREGLPETDAALLPVTAEKLEQWRQIYNERMADVNQGAFMSIADAQKLLAQGNGYFVHREGTLLGIGIAEGEEVSALASVHPGGGRATLLALNHALSGERICLTVASSNARAMHLYENMGFISVDELSVWYRIQ